MRYLMTNLPLSLGEEKQPLDDLLAALLGGTADEYGICSLERLSLDARHKGSIRFLAALAFQTDRVLAGVELPRGARLETTGEPLSWRVPPVTRKPRVVVVGSGPGPSAPCGSWTTAWNP